MSFINLFSKCYLDNCLDEYLGLSGFILSILYYIIQFVYTSETFNISSFPIITIVLGIISESLYFFQGYFKNSSSIMLTRGITIIAFIYILFIWFYNKYKKQKEKFIN